ncbi:hypothetical protein PIOMA14_I_1680 [Prevotella intermedia]|uniref:Uncharacterized protein n=2 Tax=root TaxID=1 RepID=A0A0S3UJ58_PREIN|nr:hypothetical protein [Prevotella intermedia]BAU17530.1 hypothetical protein PIOMA14_I_1022 [Prevotella intermedia]BAU18188.1 hypothetical protein PIOMA14_I_1680 [Prevotella intermedia]DAF84680.1 MAG TPA: hypothetical protein [Myoviridae sp. ctLEM34]
MMTKIEMEAMEAVIGIRKELARQNEIDWEQRRYEIAKECLPTVYQTALEIAKKTGVIEEPKDIVAVAVDLADVLIENLKKDKE